MMGDMNDKLSYALIEDDITIEQLQRFLMKTQDMMRYISILSPNQVQPRNLLSHSAYLRKC